MNDFEEECEELNFIQPHDKFDVTLVSNPNTVSIYTDSAYWEEMMDHFICSNCNCEINDTYSIEYGYKWNYCPNCGLKMTKIVGMHGEEYEI